MFYKIINSDTLQIEHSYEAEEKLKYGGSWGQYPHIAVPDGLDPDCVKAESHQETITIVDVPGYTIPAVTHEETVVVVDTPAVTHEETIVVTDVPEVLDENGNVITPAITHEEIIVVVDVPAITHDEVLVVTDVPAQDIPAVTHQEEITVYTLVADAAKLAAKAQQAKINQVTVLGAALWSEVLSQMELVYGTKDMNSATANYLTWQDMLSNENDYVGPELGFLDGTAVRIFAEGKLAQARTYAKWRSVRIKQFETAKNAILGV